MVDFHSPAIIEDDFRTYIPRPITVPDCPLNFHFGSDCGEVLACRGWHFHVSPAAQAVVPSPHYILRNFIPHLLPCSSWEFVTGLEYEWSVIRGHRPCLWTTWVCSLLLLGHGGPGAVLTIHPSRSIP